jgi:hypothetical protein
MSLVGVNSNAAVDTFARRLKETLDKLRVSGVNIVRLHSYDFEFRRTMAPLSNKLPGAKDANWYRTSAEAEQILAAGLATNMQDQSSPRPASTEACRDLSLHEAAMEFHLRNPQRDYRFHLLLRSIASRKRLDYQDMSALRAGTKQLYKDFLSSFTGVVCATATAVTHQEFHSVFRPTSSPWTTANVCQRSTW